MPRPPKYTDDDIAGAIEALISRGKEVNPSRVKHLLGGGNVSRIKAVIDRRSAGASDVEGDKPDLPVAVVAEIKRHSDQSLEGTRQLAAKLWGLACDEALSEENESATLRTRISDLEKNLSEAARELARVTSEAHRENRALADENRQLAEQREKLKEALRSAESDLRASDRTIAILERTQRQDREEIRSLQRRAEELVAKLAAIKANG